jgi:hypothetical protein
MPKVDSIIGIIAESVILARSGKGTKAISPTENETITTGGCGFVGLMYQCDDAEVFRHTHIAIESYIINFTRF